MLELVCFLDRINQTDSFIEGVGEKARGITRLIQMQLPVPDGFVIHKDLYESFISANGIFDKIYSFSKQTENVIDDRQSALGESIRLLIYETELQTSLRNQISEAFSGLKKRLKLSNAVAVRSSIVAARGQKLPYEVDTFLYIKDEYELFRSIKGCWASLWTDWALSCRAESGLAHHEAMMGIVVQEMIEAESSGVLYTRNPVTGNEDEMVIDACWGLGEGASQGRTDTDNFLINKSTFAIQTNIGDKSIMVVPDQDMGSGTKEKVLTAEQRTQSVLSENQVKTFVELGLDVEKRLGQGSEIEWAWHQEKPYILQVKEMTLFS